jgi:hypothetical protein
MFALSNYTIFSQTQTCATVPLKEGGGKPYLTPLLSYSTLRDCCASLDSDKSDIVEQRIIIRNNLR